MKSRIKGIKQKIKIVKQENPSSKKEGFLLSAERIQYHSKKGRSKIVKFYPLPFLAPLKCTFSN
ncbi:MAG: hypothetical protein ACYTBP_01325 [Planctomycetota bacterium]|jgi:hypothetical protein